VTLSRRVRILLIAPAILVLILTFILPMISDVRLSFSGNSNLTGVINIVTLEQYRQIFHNSSYLTAWTNTLRIAILSAVFCTLFGALISYGLWRVGGRTRSIVSAVIIAPLLVSGVVRAYGWVAALGPAGLLPHVTNAVGLGHVTMLYDNKSMIIAFVHALLPYSLLIMLASFDKVDGGLLRAASSLGARPLRTARLILLPMIYPGLVASVLLTFVMASAAYSIPAIVGGPRRITAATAIYREQNVYLDWPAAAALALTLAVGTLVIMLVYQALTRRTTLRVDKHA
jgi:putative spermidine/putrescine transport system permease protein